VTLRGDLRGDPELPVYRIEFHRVDEPDPRSVRAAQPATRAADLAAGLISVDQAEARLRG